MPDEVDLSQVGEAETGSENLGETGVEATTQETIEEPEYDYLDVDDEIGGKYVRIKVDGEELSVPLNEALQGYSRTKDYTQKSQQTADLRREAEEAVRVWEAIQANPSMTVKILADRAGMSVEEFVGLSPRQQAQAVAEEEYQDPLERQLAEERQARIALQERLDARDADEALERAANGLKQNFGASDEQVRAVALAAMRGGYGFESFPMIYQAMAFQASQQAQQQATATQEAQEAQRRAAAAAAAQVVGTGGSATGLTSTPGDTKYNSIREAAAAAIEEVEQRHR